MEFRILTIVFLVSISIFSSCRKEVKVDIPGYVEKVVVDGSIETGQPPLVLLSKTQNIYSATSLESYLKGFISGAVVTVSNGFVTEQLVEICSDNLPPGTEALAAQIFGVSIAELSTLKLCAYTSLNPALFGQVGKTYDLTISYDGKTYTSSTQILSPTPLDSLYWKNETATPGYGFSWAYLTDPVGKGDNYLWQAKRINDDPVTGEDKDQNFNLVFNPLFNDEFVDGKGFEFAYENPGDRGKTDVPQNTKFRYKQGDSVVIKFSKMDDNVFEFLEKKYLQLQSGGSPFSSPTFIKTNITGGAIGLWAGYSPWLDTLVCEQ
jgi:hypothetical protein